MADNHSYKVLREINGTFDRTFIEEFNQILNMLKSEYALVDTDKAAELMLDIARYAEYIDCDSKQVYANFKAVYNLIKQLPNYDKLTPTKRERLLEVAKTCLMSREVKTENDLREAIRRTAEDVPNDADSIIDRAYFAIKGAKNIEHVNTTKLNLVKQYIERKYHETAEAEVNKRITWLGNLYPEASAEEEGLVTDLDKAYAVILLG